MIEAVAPAILPAGPSPAVDGAGPARGIGAAAAASETHAVDFSAMLGQLAASASGALKTAEAASFAGVRGQASVQQVVDAVMSAEQTLHGTIAIRDKVVAAYLEISRMQI
jgi:flagellar hook-basal body complex protein FliE